MDEEVQHLLESRYKRETGSASEEEWSENSSENSYFSDSDSSIPEWESSIEDNGNLLYLDYVNSLPQASDANQKQPFSQGPERKSTRGKFLRLIRRRDSKRRSKRPQKPNDIENKVTFRDQDEGELKIVRLQLDNVPSKLGRRGKLMEVVLGINTSTFSDGNRIMVAGFTPESKIKNDKNIKIGDWLRSINNVRVTSQNVCQVLEQLETCAVTLELQCVTGVEVTKLPPSSELANHSNFVKQLTNQESKNIDQLLLNFTISILYLDLETLSETSSEFNEIIYSFPSPHRKNLLCLCRGVFITLTHLMHDITNTFPKITSFRVRNKTAHVVMNRFNKNKLLLLLLPDDSATFTTALFINGTIIRLLNFMFGNFEKCFVDKNVVHLDNFFLKFFMKTLCNGYEIAQSMDMLKNPPSSAEDFKFEQVLPAAHFISLPNEAQMQIDDALSELEASDYRDWNEDPLDCQRLFTVLGSAFYHSGYLLLSHLIHDDLIDIHLYCREHGFFHLSQTESIKNLIHWREVFPLSCKNLSNNREEEEEEEEEYRRYLMVVGSFKDILVVLMEAGGCTEPPDNNLGPDAFYVEEAQATLAHIQQLGISELAERILNTNPGTQVDLPVVATSKKKADFLGNMTFSRATTSKEKAPAQKRQPPQVTSILKHKNSDQNSVQLYGSLFSIPDDNEVHSEDSVSQGGYSERSEMSDEPVMGRRALRERNKHLEDSDDDESDVEDYRDGSQLSTGSLELSELRNALLNENNYINPIRLNAGEKVTMYHYVQLNFTRGILLAPPNSTCDSPVFTEILNNFRQHSQHIHEIFKNSSRFKSMPTQSISKSAMNKSLIAIKEYGTMFDVNYLDETAKKSCKISYWIMGKLFHLPQPKELYVCYEDSIPQNMVEIAFKLGISASV